MEWQKVLENRNHTFVFDGDRIPDRSLIDTMVSEMHRKCPSKQKRVLYQLHILDQSDPDLRLDLYKHTNRNPDKPVDPGHNHYNPQVLAPYLLVWSMRDANTVREESAEDDLILGKELNAEYRDEQYMFIMANLEVGLSSMFVALSAAAHGLAAGFCKCIQAGDEIKEKYGFEPILMMGIGYPAEDGGSYYCPINRQKIPTPSDDWLSKPEIDQYVHYSV